MSRPTGEAIPKASDFPHVFHHGWRGQIATMDAVLSYVGESIGDGILSVQDFGGIPATLVVGNVTSTGEQWVGTITVNLAAIPGDSVINVADVTHLANMLSGIIPTEPNPQVAGLNDDGVVNALDLDILVEMIVAP